MGRQAVSELTHLLGRLRDKALARAAFIVSEDGAMLRWDTEPGVSADALGSVAVRHIGGVEGLAGQLQTTEFGVVFHNSPTENVYVAVLGRELLLAVLFDESRTSLGAVRLCVKAFRDEVIRVASDELPDE